MSRVRHKYISSEFEYQLEMTYDSMKLVPARDIPAGYTLRQFEPDDATAYLELFSLAWPDQPDPDEVVDCALKGGFFVVEHEGSGRLAASCIAGRGPARDGRDQDRAWLGWLVTDPEHTRRGLGTALVASVTNVLVRDGNPNLFLGTEDARLQAISVYLTTGWKPRLHADGMAERWAAIYEQLGRDRAF